MSEVFEQVAAIEESAVQKASVASLRDAPNRGGTYGADGLTAQQLKAKFDALPLLVKGKLHELIAAYNNLVASIAGGDLGKALTVNGLTLPEALEELAADIIGEHGAETIKTIAELSAAIGNDPQFAVNVQAAIQKKADETTVQSLAGAVDKKAESSTVTALADTVSRKSAVKVGGNIVAEFDADAFADSVIALLVDGAPEALNTLREIAAALENDPNFATGIIENAKKAAADAAAEAVEGKLDKVSDRYRVYATDGSGKQVSYGFSTTLVKSTIPMRKISGEIETGTAISEKDAVPLAQMNEALAEKDEEIGILQKRVVNLEQGITPDPYLTDDSVAYVKDIPANALPYARLEAVGGMTHKEAIELPLGYDLEAYDTDTGWSTDPFVQLFPDAVVGETYTLAYDVDVEGGFLYLYDAANHKGNTFTLTENTHATVNAGSESGEYPEYTRFTNVRLIGESTLRETKVTAVESVGRNLYNGGFGGGCATEENGVLTMVKVSDTKRASAIWYPPFPLTELCLGVNVLENNAVAEVTAVVKHENNAITYIAATPKGKTGTWSASAQARADGSKIKSVQLYFQTTEEVGVSVKITDIIIQPNATPADKTFTPYRKNTLPIPAEVQALDGYGWGIPDGAHNGIEWDEDGRAVYVQRVWKFVGTASDFSHISTSATLGVYFSKKLSPASKGNDRTTLLVCNKLPNRVPKQYEKGAYITSGTAIFFVGDYATTLEEWKACLDKWEAAGDPLVLYYELETPIVTDISHLMTRDNFLPVEGGGVIIAQNENADAAPTTIKYQLKEG